MAVECMFEINIFTRRILQTLNQLVKNNKFLHEYVSYEYIFFLAKT